MVITTYLHTQIRHLIIHIDHYRDQSKRRILQTIAMRFLYLMNYVYRKLKLTINKITKAIYSSVDKRYSFVFTGKSASEVFS